MTRPFIRKDMVPLAKELGHPVTEEHDRAAHRAAVEAGYASLRSYVEREPAPHAVPIKHDIFMHYEAAAQREGTTAAVVINDVLRKCLGEK